MKIKKESVEITYERIAKKHVIDIDGKKVNVRAWKVDDPELGNYEFDYEISRTDLATLTDLEHEAIGENLTELLGLKEGEEIEITN